MTSDRTIETIMRGRAKLTIGASAEHTRLADEFAAAAQSITPDNLRLMNGLWAHSERLWEAVPNITPPFCPSGGQAGAMREGARLAA